MQRTKKLTKRERKALDPNRGQSHEQAHIHCVACGRHLNREEFSTAPPTAKFVVCDHGSQFPTCVSCEVSSRMLVAEHDRTGQPVKTAGAWH
jgi:hypothetical protein